MAEDKAVYQGTGRRKTSVARVRLIPGTGTITVNKKTARRFLRSQALVNFVETPFRSPRRPVASTSSPTVTAAASPDRPALCVTASLARCLRRATTIATSSSARGICAATLVWLSARSTV